MSRKVVSVEREATASLTSGAVTEKHPAFGTIGVFRTSGQRHLFGSPLQRHQGYVTIRVNHAEKVRSGRGYYWYFARKNIIEVALSEAQFAQLITSWNVGEGVPCTLDSIPGDGLRGLSLF